MTLNVRYQTPRGTRANLDSLAASNGLKVGEVYLITDENRIAIGITTSTYETYAKVSEAGGGAVAFLNTFTGNGSQTGFTMSQSVTAAADVIVTLDGIDQLPSTDYSVSGTTLTFTTAPPNSVSIMVRRPGGSTGAAGATGATGSTGAPGGTTYTQIEIDLGSTPRKSGNFNITGAGLTIGKNVGILQCVGPYTGKGTRADESEMDTVVVTGVVTSSTNIKCYWNSPSYVRGNRKFIYMVSG